MTVSKSPVNPSEIKSCIAEHTALCVLEGAVDFVAPKASISYKHLTIKLEELGLIKPSTLSTKKSSDPDKRQVTPEKDNIVSKKQKDEVDHNYMLEITSSIRPSN